MRTATILISLLFVSVPAFADIADDVRCREIAFSQSVENQDAEAFASFIDRDARFVSSSVQRGADEIIMAWAIFFAADAPTIKWRPQYIEVLNDGSLALSRGPYRLTTTSPDGEIVDHWGTFNSVWRKQDDGSWKIIFDAGDEAAGPPADDVLALLERQEECQ